MKTARVHRGARQRGGVANIGQRARRRVTDCRLPGRNKLQGTIAATCGRRFEKDLRRWATSKGKI